MEIADTGGTGVGRSMWPWGCHFCLSALLGTCRDCALLSPTLAAAAATTPPHPCPPPPAARTTSMAPSGRGSVNGRGVNRMEGRGRSRSRRRATSARRRLFPGAGEEGGLRAPPPSSARQPNRRYHHRAEVEEAGLCFLAWWVAALCIVACLVWVRPYHNQP